MFVLEENEPWILDIDVECRPLAWYGGDFVTKQITAIAWKWVRGGFGWELETGVAYIGRSGRAAMVPQEEEDMLERFRVLYDDADIITGHFVRGFDLPLIQGSMMRRGLPLIGPKLVQDTKVDLVASQGISKSQENLGAMYELDHPKIAMNTHLWEAGNMLLPEGIESTIKRVTGDVEQHVELRKRMLELGHLGPPQLWDGHDGRVPGYVA